MKQIIRFLILAMFTSCSFYMSTIMNKPFDFSIINQKENQFYLPSMHSAIKVDILEQRIIEDTLEIKYQAGTGEDVRSNELIYLTNEIKFLKCKNIYNCKKTIQLYEILFNEGDYKIVFLGNIRE